MSESGETLVRLLKIKNMSDLMDKLGEFEPTLKHTLLYHPNEARSECHCRICGAVFPQAHQAYVHALKVCGPRKLAEYLGRELGETDEE